jgi:hypothetical protein
MNSCRPLSPKSSEDSTASGDALLAPTDRKKQQQVVAELWLWAGGRPHAGEASGSVMFFAVRCVETGTA